MNRHAVSGWPNRMREWHVMLMASSTVSGPTLLTLSHYGHRNRRLLRCALEQGSILLSHQSSAQASCYCARLSGPLHDGVLTKHVLIRFRFKISVVEKESWQLNVCEHCVCSHRPLCRRSLLTIRRGTVARQWCSCCRRRHSSPQHHD